MFSLLLELSFPFGWGGAVPEPCVDHFAEAPMTCFTFCAHSNDFQGDLNEIT